MSFSSRNLTDVLPIFRNEIFEDVVLGNYGDICKVWLVPGHLLVSCDNGSKLHALDCVPANRHQNTTDQGPGFENLSPPVLDIIVSELYADVIFIVQQNGHVQCWQYTEYFSWDRLVDFDICNTTGTEVVSVCVHPTHNLMYWCERRTSNLTTPLYCVCKRSLPQDVYGLKKKDVGSAVAVVHNCPACDVFPVGNNLFISSRHPGDGVHVSLVINPDTDLVSLFVGDSKLELNKFSSSHVVDLRAVLVQCLSAVTKSNQLRGTVGVQFDPMSQTTAVVYEDGNVRLYHCETDKKTDVVVTSGTLPHHPGEMDTNRWFVTKHVIGVVDSSTVRLFDVVKGCQLPEVTSPDGSDIEGIIVSTTSTVTAGFYTKTNFFLIQRDSHKDHPTDFSSISETQNFQTEALHIAYLIEIRHTEQLPETKKKLDELHKIWKDKQTRPTKSKLSQLVDPYLFEFWRLEEMTGSIFDDGEVSTDCGDVSPRSEILDRSQSLVTQEARLLWMSEKSPNDVLQVLCEGLQFDTDDDVESEDMSRWLTVLGLDDDGAVQGGSNSLIFDHICRLLFKLEPSRLIVFVRCAQRVSEQTIGVSAFVRKKHTSLYYKRAVGCLPDPSMSCNPDTASQVTAQLIRACGEEHDPERALKLLLQYKQWQASITLVKQQDEKSQLRACLLYITLSHLAQHQILAQFAEDIFSMVPTWQSFLTLSDVITGQPDIRQRQLSNSAPDVMCRGPPDISLGAVRPLLLQLLQQHTATE
ncbi:uncharacterized protein LOC121373940 [Gigantopelta aegis]|uniref:uncharacterized protein LOC121373940 n=1 Tax=Gigantopelta aegis TaxID=1735272 RepID=UPI001B88BB1A|nr:uncharacterized protein LOC121373940 [Gigantopelta aegis]